jgi:TetR/AcrR family transcriptional regulator
MALSSLKQLDLRRLTDPPDGLVVARRQVYQCNKGRIELSTIWLEMAERRSNRTKPQRRDPVATRNKLLTAARHEFSKNGLAGARVDEIALRAGVNKQLVYHYFGDKDALYLAVLEWVYEEIRAQERKLNLTGLPPERAIKKLIESSFDHLARYPDFIVLLNDENRNGARHVRASRKLESMHSPLVSLVSTILREGVQAGIFRKGVNPVHLYISIAGLSYFFFSNTPTLSAIFGTDLSSAAAKRARRKHVVDLVMNALRPTV